MLSIYLVVILLRFETITDIAIGQQQRLGWSCPQWFHGSIMLMMSSRRPTQQQ
jgi:hypothetical protein